MACKKIFGFDPPKTKKFRHLKQCQVIVAIAFQRESLKYLA